MLFVVSKDGVPSHARVLHLDYPTHDHADKADLDREVDVTMR
jgi:hypothetical protein